MKMRYLAFQNSGRKYVENFADGIAVSKKNYYLCNPIIEDDYAQPADNQLFREKAKVLIKK